MNPLIFTSNKITKNNFVCFIEKKWYIGVNLFLKNELFYSMSMISDMSTIDTLKYNRIFQNKFQDKNRFLMFNLYYFYTIKIRLTLMFISKKNTPSIDSLYKNSNWMEREVSEMYGINYDNKKDVRSLLLDYSRNEFPMLKDFPTEGYNDIYYNFFENKLKYSNKNEFIEL